MGSRTQLSCLLGGPHSGPDTLGAYTACGWALGHVPSLFRVSMMTTWVEEEREKQERHSWRACRHLTVTPPTREQCGGQEGPPHPHLPTLEGSVEHCDAGVAQSLKRALCVLDPQACLFLGAHQKLLSGGAQNEICGRWRSTLKPS